MPGSVWDPTSKELRTYREPALSYVFKMNVKDLSVLVIFCHLRLSFFKKAIF